MGLEARCQITWNGESRTTAVHLDSAVVEVRGRRALKLPFASVRRTSVRAGELVLEAAAARSAGLVDVKVVAFSETQSADKLVIPKSDRAPAKAKPSAKPATKKRSPKDRLSRRHLTAEHRAARSLHPLSH